MSTSINLPTITGELAGLSQTLVNARELHAALGVESHFKDWIARRIETYGFIEGVDYRCSNLSSKQNQGLSRFMPGHNRKDYHLSLDMAKELAMLENNETGRAIRRNLIETERQMREEVPAIIRRQQYQIEQLRAAGLAANPEWAKLARYYQMDLSLPEIGRLLGCSGEAVRHRLKGLAARGLIDYQPSLAHAAAGRRAIGLRQSGEAIH